MGTSGGGADRDTTFAAYTGNPGGLTEVAGNDDSAGLHAAVTFDVRAGSRYLLAVDGFTSAGGTGPFTLTWATQVASAPGTPHTVAARPGDGSAVITWSAPDANRSPITHYTLTAKTVGQEALTSPSPWRKHDGHGHGSDQRQ